MVDQRLTFDSAMDVLQEHRRLEDGASIPAVDQFDQIRWLRSLATAVPSGPPARALVEASVRAASPAASVFATGADSDIGTGDASVPSTQDVAPTPWEQFLRGAEIFEPLLAETVEAGPCPFAVPTLLRLAELLPKALNTALTFPALTACDH